MKQTRNESNITYYSFENADCTVREVFFNYREYTPKKTAAAKYDGSPMEIDYVEEPKVELSNKQTVLKKRSRKKAVKNVLKPNEKKINLETKNKSRAYQIAIVIIFLLMMYLLCYQFLRTDSNCDCEINEQLLCKDLLDNVQNQTECVDLITSSLHDRKQWQKKLKVLVFIGTMGVGKTFVTNIVKTHFPKQAVHEVVYLNEEVINLECCNLVVIDNLSTVLLDDVINVINSMNSNRVTLVLAVFNVQKTDRNLNYYFDEEAVRTILKEFKSSSLDFKSCLFNNIDKSDVHIWLTNQLTQREIKRTSRDSITRYVLANTNFTRNGFKGLAQKLSIAVEIYN